MSQLKKIREEKNLTQEELSEKSGLSVRTIQHIEAGTEPKGYTLKTLASMLDISEKDLLISNNLRGEIETEKPILTTEKEEIFNSSFIKMINLSSLPFAWFINQYFGEKGKKEKKLLRLKRNKFTKKSTENFQWIF